MSEINEKLKEDILNSLNNFKIYGISHGEKNLNEVIKYQDIIGRSSLKDITLIYPTFDQRQKEIFVWVNANTLSFDMFIDIIKNTVVYQYRHDVFIEADNFIADREKELNKQSELLNSQKASLNDCKKPIYKKINKLSKENKDLKDEIIYIKQLLEHEKSIRITYQKSGKERDNKLNKINEFFNALSIINKINKEFNYETDSN